MLFFVALRGCVRVYTVHNSLHSNPIHLGSSGLPGLHTCTVHHCP